LIPNHERNPQDGRYSSRYLSRKRVVHWNEPAYTVLTSPRDASLHPGGESNERGDYMGEFNLTPQLPENGLTVLELFCGGGLGAVGFKAAGYDIVKALDFDKNAVAAYRHNLGDHVEQADINSVDIGSLPNTDIIFGGPPCQDYSVAGNGAGEEGERGKLVFRYLDIIKEKQPKAFVFENVKGLLTKKHRATFDALLTQFSEIGYEVSWQLIMAWDYGVAQKRERVFIVGVRQDLGISFEFPQPLEGDYRTKVLRDVIGDLPEPYPNHEPKELSEKAIEYMFANWEHRESRIKTMEQPAATISAVLAKGVPYGVFYPNHSAKHYWSPKSEYTYDQANRVQSLDKPCNTIPAHHNSGQPIHPTEAPRRFTVREAMRIQSVPDTYVIPDDIALGNQYKIVGNGIASRVAWYIGKALAEQLNA
jgi:DNA (cytosine-5)-methyltransferase 1